MNSSTQGGKIQRGGLKDSFNRGNGRKFHEILNYKPGCGGCYGCDASLLNLDVIG